MTPSRFLSVAEFACKTARSLFVGKGAPTLPGPLDDGDLLAAAEENVECWEPHTPRRRPVVLPTEFDTPTGIAALLRHHGVAVEFAERAVEAKAANTAHECGECDADYWQGAPGDTHTCRVCGVVWIAEEAGPLDIEWVIQQSPVASAGAGPVAPGEATRPDSPASPGVLAAIVATLGKHRYSPVNHSSIGSADHCSCGERPWTEQSWRKHVAPLIAAALDGAL